MLETFIEQKELDNKNLSKQFDNWLYRDRGRQIRGIEFFLNKRSENIDNLIREIAIQTRLNSINDFGIFSVGGYGRGELHPYSDIDLLLLSKSNLSKSDQKKIELFISILWDLDFEVGHSVRTIEQARNQAREDLYTMTNMLEFRILFGNETLHKEYLKIIDTKNLWRNKSFIQAKIQEQIERHKSFNNTSYNLEPDIKSSPGGLRDIHTIDWLIKNAYRRTSEKDKLSGTLSIEERKELNKSKHWLWVIRYLMHIEAKREEDRLLFEYQIPVANKLFPSAKTSNQAAEKLMHRFADLIEGHAEELGQLEALDVGMPSFIGQYVEVGNVLETLRYMAGWPTKINGRTMNIGEPMPEKRYFAYTSREPVGVVGAIVPWNVPLMIAMWKIAPALATGCTIVIKPSEVTPLATLRLAELAVDAGIPSGVINDHICQLGET